MGDFQTKNPNLGKFWRVYQAMGDVGIFYGHLVYFMAIWYILVYFTAIWYISWHFGTLFLVAPRKILQPWSWCKWHSHYFDSCDNYNDLLLMRWLFNKKLNYHFKSYFLTPFFPNVILPILPSLVSTEADVVKVLL
jgi:hypothetical protein